LKTYHLATLNYAPFEAIFAINIIKYWSQSCDYDDDTALLAGSRFVV
jgi:hypothetical protein